MGIIHFGPKPRTQKLSEEQCQAEITRLGEKARHNKIPLVQRGNRIHLGNEQSSRHIDIDTSYYEGAEDAIADWMDRRGSQASNYIRNGQPRDAGLVYCDVCEGYYYPHEH